VKRKITGILQMRKKKIEIRWETERTSYPPGGIKDIFRGGQKRDSPMVPHLAW
jgi:hypothetical protein